jgi:hypothetical protein
MWQIDNFFQMKKGSIGPPPIYLSGKMSKVTLQNGVEAWAKSPSKYVQEAVKNLETYILHGYDGQMLV